MPTRRRVSTHTRLRDSRLTTEKEGVDYRIDKAYRTSDKILARQFEAAGQDYEARQNTNETR